LRSLQRAAALDMTDIALQRQVACDAARLGRYPVSLSAIAALPPRFELLPSVELSFTVPLDNNGRDLARGVIQGRPDSLACVFKKPEYLTRDGQVSQRQECQATWERKDEEIFINIQSTVVHIDFCDDDTQPEAPPSPCAEDRTQVTARCQVPASGLLTARGGRGLKVPVQCKR